MNADCYGALFVEVVEGIARVERGYPAHILDQLLDDWYDCDMSKELASETLILPRRVAPTVQAAPVVESPPQEVTYPDLNEDPSEYEEGEIPEDVVAPETQMMEGNPSWDPDPAGGSNGKILEDEPKTPEEDKKKEDDNTPIPPALRRTTPEVIDLTGDSEDDDVVVTIRVRRSRHIAARHLEY